MVRVRIQQGIAVAAEKQVERVKARVQSDVAGRARAWYDQHIVKDHKYPEVVWRVVRRHITPVIG